MKIATDDNDMAISGASMTNALAGMASDMHSQQIGLELATAVLKQIQDQQNMQAQALLEMIRNTPSPSGTGQIVNIIA